MIRGFTQGIDRGVQVLDGIQNPIETAERAGIQKRGRNPLLQPYSDDYTVWEAAESPSIIPSHLEPIGDTGIYITPNNPVDPRDCDRWPDSPWCGGNGLSSPSHGIGAIGTGVTIETSFNQCEVCVTTHGSLFWISGPPATVCYRRPDCVLPEPEPEPQPPLPGGSTPTNKQCVLGPLYRWESIRSLGQDYASFISWLNGRLRAQYDGYWEQLQEIYPGVSRVDYSTAYDSIAINTRLYRYQGEDKGIVIRDYYFNIHDVADEHIHQYPRLSVNDYTWEHFTAEGEFISRSGYDQYTTWPVYFPDCPSNPLPPPPYTPPTFQLPHDPETPTCEPMNCNCEEMAEMIEALYLRLGCDQFPVSVPDTLIEDGANRQIEKADVPSLMAWMVEQIDALTGQFPIEIEIEDTDPTQEGNQTQSIRLPNIAETLAELYGLLLKTSVTSDLHTDINLRLVAEVLSIKNASIVTQDYARANASFLGYRGNPKKRKINYSFDPENLGDLTKVLNESTKEVLGWTEEDPETVVGFLQRIVFVSGLLKEIFFRNKDRMPNLIEEIEGLTTQQEGSDESWNAFLRDLNDPQSLQNQKRPTPKAIDLNTEET